MAELKQIADRHHGVITPEATVEFAQRHVNSELHTQFSWDLKKAAYAHWLYEARQIITIFVDIVDTPQGPIEVQTYQSLKSDRKNKKGGYRFTTTILSSADMRRQLLQDALEDFELFERKYAQLTELAEMFRLSRRLREEYR